MILIDDRRHDASDVEGPLAPGVTLVREDVTDAIELGAVVSVLATATRVEDFPESLVGKSSRGVEGCAAAAVVALGAGFTAGFGASTAGAAAASLASADARAVEGIGVPSGLNETVLTGFGSGN